MLRLLIVIAIVAAVWYLARALRAADPARRRQRYWQLGLAAFALTLILLAAAGRIHWLGAVLGALLPIARVLLVMLAQQLPQLLRRTGGAAGGGAGSRPAAATTAMNREEALAVLGLREGASRDEVIQAHRRLMQRLHPDRGGNDYLAAKLNTAKELLLGP
jgi:hypothetical protein